MTFASNYLPSSDYVHDGEVFELDIWLMFIIYKIIRTGCKWTFSDFSAYLKIFCLPHDRIRFRSTFSW
jgi:hypothetical protein